MGGQVFSDNRDAFIDLGPDSAATGVACCLDVFEREGLALVRGVDGFADELVAVEDPDFGDISGVVADCDWFSDIGGQDRRDVAKALKSDAVAVHDAALGNGQEQLV